MAINNWADERDPKKPKSKKETKIYILKKEADEQIMNLALEIDKLKRSNASLRGHLKKTKDELKSLKFLM